MLQSTVRTHSSGRGIRVPQPPAAGANRRHRLPTQGASKARAAAPGAGTPGPEASGDPQAPAQPVHSPQQPAPQHTTAPRQAPPDDDEPLWWVQKFEQRRQQQQQQQQPSQQQQLPQQQQQQQQQPLQRAPWPAAAKQVLQLAAVVGALMLWPASLYPGGLSNGRVWWAYVTYLAFFGGGTVWRLLRYGPLAARQRDQQARAWGPRAAQACFIAAMPLLHWGAVGGLLRCQAAAAGAGASAPAAAAAPAAAGTIVLEGFAQSSGASSSSVFSSLALYDALGFALLAAAVALNWAAARALGQAYDRVVQPQALVTTRPYAWVQHPIHASYTLLFCGVSVCMHSFGCALLALAVCLVYCRSRVALEGAVLQAAFGDAYDACRRATPKLFAPFLL